MAPSDLLRQAFQTKAEAVSAVVCKVDNLAQAFAYTVDLCEHKEACQVLAAGCGEPLSTQAGSLCRTKQQKVIAARDRRANALRISNKLQYKEWS
jgi:L-lactate dehydrogenase complex protein LldG